MKKLLTLMVMPVVLTHVLLPAQVFGQWSTSGNTLGSTGKLGSTNSQSVSFITNNTERINISPAGSIMFNGLGGSGNGIILLNSDGVASRLSLSGSSSDVLTGAGTFSNMSGLSGWTLGSGIATTTRKIGIGITSPVNMLEVAGNGLFSGTVYAQDFVVADLSTVQGHLAFSASMYMYGYDALAGTRNEIYTTGEPYYIQSQYLTNSNTIINYGNTGMVGIGTNTPSAKFHVSGASRFDGAVRVDSLQLGDNMVMKAGAGSGWDLLTAGPAGGTFAYLTPSCIDKGSAGTLQSVKGFYSAWADAGSVTMGHNGTHAFIQSYGDGQAGVLKLNYFCGKDVAICAGGAGGNVGVGTATPDDKMQIKTGAYSITFGSALYPGLYYGTSYMGFNAARTAAGTWKTDTDGSHNGGVVWYGNVTGDVFLATLPDNGAGSTGQSGITDSVLLGNTRWYMAATGETGFGTRCIPAGFKMAVDGRIVCEGVKVKNSDSTGCWPDYVFDAGYKPMSIGELDVYVKTNKHLPGIPSQEQVSSEGVDLLELNRAMLKSLEESHLYIIQLKKENEAMRQELQELRSLIKN